MTLQPSCFLQYIDDTFLIWPHGEDTLQQFVDHMNGVHSNINFTIEMEKDGKLPFLESRRSAGFTQCIENQCTLIDT